MVHCTVCLYPQIHLPIGRTPSAQCPALRATFRPTRRSRQPLAIRGCLFGASCGVVCRRWYRRKKPSSLQSKKSREELMQPRNAESRYWKWKEGITVHYAKAESKIPSDIAVVLLHGFGVASFHYESQFLPLSEAGYTVYAIGQRGCRSFLAGRGPSSRGTRGVAGDSWEPMGLSAAKQLKALRRWSSENPYGYSRLPAS